MQTLSFDLDTSKKFYLKLLEDYEDFKQDSISSRHAINCAMTAFHLIEWIYYEYDKGPKNKKEVENFQSQLKTMCPSLQIMHDITNGSKHYFLKSHKPIVDKTSISGGGFDGGAFSRGFDIPTADIDLKDGSKLYFEDELKIVVDFWRDYFINELGESFN